VDLTYVLTTLRRAWWLLALAAALGAGAAAVVNATSAVTFAAQVQQFVSIADSSDNQSNILSGSQFTLQRVKSYTQVATSAQVLDPVIQKLKLPTTTGELAGHVTATNPLDTVLIEIAVTDTDPGRAADIANAVAKQLSRVVQDIESPQSGAPAPVKLTTTQPASVPTTPVAPRKSLNLALGLLVGLAAGAGGALLREQLNTTVKTPDDIETLTGSVPLGLVPFDAAAKAQPLVTADQGDGRAEAFRTLRTNLRFADVDHPPRSIVVTSPMPGEGKSVSACNIALTLALAGSKVVLIEADLRKPRVGEYLGLDSGVGLTNVLAGQHALEDVLVPWRRQTLTVLPAGPVPPNPSELLGSQHMASLLTTLSAQFDYVIVDSPPLLPVTDAAVLSTLTDGALLIARHGKSSRDDLEQAAHALEAVNAKLLGTVLNCIPLRAAGYSYGYGYGYAEDRPATATKKTKKARPAPRARVARNTERSEALRRRVAVPEREGGEQFQLDLDAYLQSTRRD
jgi:capsular exopolysaccharide synthesis family protein